MNKSENKKKNIRARLTYAYLRRVKKWMYCPECTEGKMSINKKHTIWTCEDCGYQLSVEEFEDDYIFWFCDECEVYLNTQDGFNKYSTKHICKNCGYENDTTFNNLKGVCVDCGKFIPDPEATLCVDCKIERTKKAKQRAKDAAAIAGVAVLAGLSFVASQTDEDEDDTDYLLSDGNTNLTGEQCGFDYVTESWLKNASEDDLRNTSTEMRKKLDEIDYDSDEYLQLDLLHIDIVNAIASRFPLNLPKREHGWYLPNDD